MTDHANELRRYSRKIGHPAGDVPSVMLAAADEIERLAARLEATEEDRSNFLVEMGKLCAQCDALRLRIKAAEKERDDVAQQLVQSEQGKRKISEECDTLRVKIAAMEKRLRLILEEPENTMSNSKALREMVRQARLALEESK